MREVCLTLDFTCCGCAEPLTMLVKCGGVGLLQGPTNAAVAVACPLCDNLNDLVFDTAGTVHRVAPLASDWALSQPSLN